MKLLVSQAPTMRLSGVRSFSTLARNVVKVTVPWLVGHAAVFSIVEASATGTIPILVATLTALAYVLPVV